MHGSVWGRAIDLMLWKKKRMREERVTKGTKRERKSQEEDKNCEISQITWHVLIGWRKSSVLHQLRIEFKLNELLSIKIKESKSD